MASEALSIPIDIPWQRLAWSRDMLDRSYADGLPPKWRSSLAVYAYVVPLVDTEDDYPDDRIIYLKLTASITGWSPSEELDGSRLPDPTWDAWQRAAWEAIAASPQLTRSYWPCVSAIAQIGIYPRPEVGVPDEDFPSIIDFEPKKRELYETVNETGEVMSGSAGNINIRKGSTSTHSVEVSASATVKGGIPGVGSAESSLTATYGYSRESVDITTTDQSTERRETAGRTTQLSQMYQLFTGYHIGTNRAVFVVFPRPHIVTDAAQANNNLINGERKLEGVQDVFVVVQVPRRVAGICVRAFLDTGHKIIRNDGTGTHLVVTRRRVGGCGELEGDRLQPVAAPADPIRVPPIVGEHELEGRHGSYRSRIVQGHKAQIAVADELNLVQADNRAAILGDVVSTAIRPKEFVATATFRSLVTTHAQSVRLDLPALRRLGYIADDKELQALRAAGIDDSAELFVSSKKTPAIVTTVRARLVDAAIKVFASKP